MRPSSGFSGCCSDSSLVLELLLHEVATIKNRSNIPARRNVKSKDLKIVIISYLNV
jgi:hypothetical protein